MALKIPCAFRLLGHQWRVEWSHVLLDEEDLQGSCSYRKHVITLQANNNGHWRPSSSLEQTFLHELVHAVLYAAGQHDLRRDEEAVDLIAGLLHQALVTMEYDDDRS